MSAETIVRQFLDHLVAQETEAAVALLTDNVVWRNTGMPTFEGKRVGAALRDMERRGVRFEVVYHHVAADGDVVLTDRTDVIGKGAWQTSFGVRGTFELREGKIAVWDDAFSWLELVGSGVLGLGRILTGK